jgi:hypothetical protein
MWDEDEILSLVWPSEQGNWPILNHSISLYIKSSIACIEWCNIKKIKCLSSGLNLRLLHTNQALYQ